MTEVKNFKNLIVDGYLWPEWFGEPNPDPISDQIVLGMISEISYSKILVQLKPAQTLPDIHVMSQFHNCIEKAFLLGKTEDIVELKPNQIICAGWFKS